MSEKRVKRVRGRGIMTTSKISGVSVTCARCREGRAAVQISSPVSVVYYCDRCWSSMRDALMGEDLGRG